MARKVLVSFLIFLGIFFFLGNRQNFQDFFQVFRNGDWRWLIFALVTQALHYLSIANLYRVSFALVRVPVRLSRLVQLVLGALVINVITPSAGAGGTALFLDDAARAGRSTGRTAAGTLLVLITQYGVLLPILAASLFFLDRQNSVVHYEIFSAGILLILVIGLIGLAILSSTQAKRLRQIAVRFQRFVNQITRRFRRKKLLEDHWADRPLRDFNQATRLIVKQPWSLRNLTLSGLLVHVINIVSFGLLFLAFHEPIIPSVVIASYAIGMLFWIVSPTPHGIGFVEGAIILTLTSLGTERPVAFALAVGFRGISFWLPLFIGFIILPRLKAFKQAKQLSYQEIGAHWVSIATGVTGLVNILAGIIRPNFQAAPWVLEGTGPLVLHYWSSTLTIMAGFFFILLARGLWQQRIIAYQATLLVGGLMVILHLLSGNYPEGIFQLLLTGWLVSNQGSFRKTSGLPSLWQGIRAMLYGLLMTLIYSSLGLFILGSHFRQQADFIRGLKQSLVLFIQGTNPAIQPLTPFGAYFLETIWYLCLLSIGIGMVLVIRSIVYRLQTSDVYRLTQPTAS